MSFGENLQFLRKKNNWTQEALAEKLEVSRQSVSKWESNSAYPEMEKLLQICELFSCNLDTLLRGDVEQSQQEDTAQYDRAMNTFSKRVATGVGLLIAGVGVQCLLSSFARMEPAADMCFMLFVVIGVILLVVAGLDRESFIKRHPVITPFYPEEQLDAFQKKFTRWIACSIGALLLGLVWMLGSESFHCRGLVRMATIFTCPFSCLSLQERYRRWPILARRRQNTTSKLTTTKTVRREKHTATRLANGAVVSYCWQRRFFCQRGFWRMRGV